MINLTFCYDDINKFNEKLPVTAQGNFLSYKSNKYGWIYNDEFVLPFYIKEKLVFKRLFFTSSIISIKDVALIDNKKKFLNEVIVLLKKNKIDIIDIPLVNSLFDCYPDNAIYTDFGSYIVDLTQSEEIIFNNIHSKHRNVIRKAEKDGVLIDKGEKYITDCYKIINDTYKRQGKSFIDYNDFMELRKQLNDNIEFYAAIKNNELQGCAVLLWNKYNCCYYYGGSITNCYAGSMNLLHYRAMLDMKKNGLKLYDFFGARINPEEGSKLEGIQRFKSRFGGHLVTGYLWKYPLNRLKYNILRFIISVICILKFQKYSGDLIDQERKRNKNNIDI